MRNNDGKESHNLSVILNLQRAKIELKANCNKTGSTFFARIDEKIVLAII